MLLSRINSCRSFIDLHGVDKSEDNNGNDSQEEIVDKIEAGSFSFNGSILVKEDIDRVLLATLKVFQDDSASKWSSFAGRNLYIDSVNTVSSILEKEVNMRYLRNMYYVAAAGNIVAKDVRGSFKSIRSLNLNCIVIVVFV